MGFILLLCGALRATEPYTPVIVNPLTESWRWRQFPELSDKGIRCLVETEDRKVFAGTTEGVLEYDGYEWRPLAHPNSPAEYPVEQLLVAADGSVYAGNRAGIYRYAEGTWIHVFAAPEKFPFNFIGLKQLTDGSILGCSDRGLVRIASTGTEIYTSARRIETLRNSLPGVDWRLLPAEALNAEADFRSVSDVMEDDHGTIWIALTTDMESGKLLRIPRQRFLTGNVSNYTVVSSDGTLNLGAEQRLLQAEDGRIWVINTSSDRGILVYDGARWENHPDQCALRRRRVHDQHYPVG